MVTCILSLLFLRSVVSIYLFPFVSAFLYIRLNSPKLHTIQRRKKYKFKNRIEIKRNVISSIKTALRCEQTPSVCRPLFRQFRCSTSFFSVLFQDPHSPYYIKEYEKLNAGKNLDTTREGTIASWCGIKLCSFPKLGKFRKNPLANYFPAESCRSPWHHTIF